MSVVKNFLPNTHTLKFTHVHTLHISHVTVDGITTTTSTFATLTTVHLKHKFSGNITEKASPSYYPTPSSTTATSSCNSNSKNKNNSNYIATTLIHWQTAIEFILLSFHLSTVQRAARTRGYSQQQQ
ncbi:unnamed protein product [Ceratitis capitata]|uniref:(Mediterranean fruit fly) hypothetical protein n=1 Tax=Ceratitis capitata TaxID=7213 RepID=A0A811UD31_CERCA|nr:unnamed protein product [Ceratitis capitata]